MSAPGMKASTYCYATMAAIDQDIRSPTAPAPSVRAWRCTPWQAVQEDITGLSDIGLSRWLPHRLRGRQPRGLRHLVSTHADQVLVEYGGSTWFAIPGIHIDYG